MRFCSGIARLDHAVGQLPCGVVEIFGQPSSGVSAMVNSILREAVLAGHSNVLIHTPGAVDADRVDSAGCDPVLVMPLCMEAALGAAFAAMRGGAKVIVLENLAMTETLDELCLDVGDMRPFAARVLLGHGLWHLQQAARQRDALVVVTGEHREMGATYAAPRSTLEDVLNTENCALRLYLRRLETKLEYDEFHSASVLIKVLDYRGVLRYNTAAGILLPHGEFSRDRELFELLRERGLLIRRGATWHDKEHGVFGPGVARACSQVRPRYGELYMFAMQTQA